MQWLAKGKVSTSISNGRQKHVTNESQTQRIACNKLHFPAPSRRNKQRRFRTSQSGFYLQIVGIRMTAYCPQSRPC
jgi:hypothetical protein